MGLIHESHLADCCTPAGHDSTARRETSSTALAEIDSRENPPDVAAIRSAGFALLLETGLPVNVADLIAATDVSPDRSAEIFASMRTHGRAEFDGEGQLVGLAGLTLTPSRHQLTIKGAIRWTWCALDAVGILGALEATGAVRSTDPHTGDTIEIAFVDGHPATDAHLFILSGHTDGNVREDWCPLVNFFTDRRGAEEWVEARGIDGDIVAVAEIVDDASAMWRRVVDPDTPRVC